MPPRSAIIIGSGPSGYASATYLLRHGWKVTMLDFGNLRKDLDRHNLPANLTNDNREALVNIEEFSWKNRRKGKESLSPERMRSHYFFEHTNDYVLGRFRAAVANISLAYGGLSNIWGGNVLPCDGRDVDEWPITRDELTPYYKALSDLIPLTADRKDGLAARFGFPCGDLPEYPIGQQAGELLTDLLKCGEALEEQGLFFGRAKLAIDPRLAIDPVKDPYPFGPIFHAGAGLGTLSANPGFRYIPDIFVEHISQQPPGSVVAAGTEVSTKSPVSFSGDKLFIACGVLATGQLMARNFDLENQVMHVRTNQNAFFPFVRFRRSKGVSRLPTNSISQLFLDIQNEYTDNRFAHIEVHQFGEYVLNPIKSILGSLTPFAVAAGRPVLERTMIFQAHLHSDFSDRLEVRYDRTNGWKADIAGMPNPRARGCYGNLLQFLARNRKSLGGWPLKQLMLVDPPGASNHLGGMFPMREQPDRTLSSDRFGRPFGCRNIHITDSTILPSLPATTLTFTVMANAARIADHVGKDDLP
jgi:choline dehydrogenase-like flavoprotein